MSKSTNQSYSFASNTYAWGGSYDYFQWYGFLIQDANNVLNGHETYAYFPYYVLNQASTDSLIAPHPDMHYQNYPASHYQQWYSEAYRTYDFENTSYSKVDYTH